MTMKRLSFTFLCFSMILGFLLTASCSNFNMREGRAEIISVSDTTLNDSSIFVGYVYDLGNSSLNYPIQDGQVWIENTNLKATPDLTGYYYIKTIPGTYTIKCQRDFNDWPQLIEEVKNVEINKNEIIHINFYLGYVDE